MGFLLFFFIIKTSVKKYFIYTVVNLTTKYIVKMKSNLKKLKLHFKKY